MQRILFILLTLNIPLLVVSQTSYKISGQIKDHITNEVVDYANISLLRGDSTFIVGNISDSLGNFILETNRLYDGYILQINHINYNKKSIRLNQQDNSIDILLEPRDNSLSEVQIFGEQKRVRNNLKLEYKVNESIRNKALRATHILENIPNIFVDYNQNIYIKGSNQILILKNGIELPSNNLIDQIPPSSIERVEIINTIPSKYASRNYTAIMNIITKRVANKVLLLDNNSSFDKKMYDAKINFSLETEKHSFYTFYKLYYRNFLEKYSNHNYLQNGLTDTTFFFRRKPRKESDNEFFYGYSFHPNSKLTIGVDGYLSLYRENFHSKYDDSFRTDYLSAKEKFNTQNYKGYVNYQDSLNKLQGVIQYNNVKVDDALFYFEKDNDEKQIEKRRIYTIQFDYKRQLKSNLSLLAGINYSRTKNTEDFMDLQPNKTLSEKFDGDNFSTYLESSLDLKEKWMFEAGINLYYYKRSFKNHTDVTSTNFYPKISIGYSINNENFLKLAYSSYIQNPSLWQMLSFAKEQSPNIYYQGNPYLKPEKHSELSMEYSYSKGSFYYANTVFFRQARHKIQDILDSRDDYYLLSYTNLSKRNDYGADMTLTLNLSKWWGVNLYADVLNRNISENTFYKKNMVSYSGQIRSNWSISSKLSVTAQYMHNSKELTYNGYNKPFNSSLVVVRYKLLENLDIYFLAIEPFAKFESKSKIYTSDGHIENINNIKVRTYLVSFTYNIFGNKTKDKKKIYNNDEKKY